MIRVCVPLNLSTSLFDPTNTIRSAFTAMACAWGCFSFAVYTLPLTKIRSAGANLSAVGAKLKSKMLSRIERAFIVFLFWTIGVLLVGLNLLRQIAVCRAD